MNNIKNGKIYCIMGKSGSGKNTVFKELLKKVGLKPIITYTTRPMRKNETHGSDYFFIDHNELTDYINEGKVIEQRCYSTVQGLWYYATIDDGQIDLFECSYLIITTLEAYKKISSYFGADNVMPLYIKVEDGLRLERALCRERTQKIPEYAEMCRRFLADSEDFNEENLQRAGIEKYYNNIDIEGCINGIIEDIN